MADAPIPSVRLLPGVVVPRIGDEDELDVNVFGNRPPVWWPAGYVQSVGDPVRVLMVDGQAHVLGPVVRGRRAGSGIVAGAAASGLVPVDTVAGTVQARYTGTAPSIGTEVFLDWQMTTPRILPGAAAAVPTPTTPGPSQPAPPPSGPQSGRMPVPSIDSGTWSSRGAWDSYYGTDLTQGSYGGRSYAGAWFYGAAPRQAAGRTITGFRIRLGARRRMGNYNSPLTLNLWLHANETRPPGDVTRGSGPHAVSLAPNAGAQMVELDPSWGTYIVNNGGGIGISGGGYGGVAGVGADAASGLLEIDWKA